MAFCLVQDQLDHFEPALGQIWRFEPSTRRDLDCAHSAGGHCANLPPDFMILDAAVPEPHRHRPKLSRRILQLSGVQQQPANYSLINGFSTRWASASSKACSVCSNAYGENNASAGIVWSAISMSARSKSCQVPE